MTLPRKSSLPLAMLAIVLLTAVTAMAAQSAAPPLPVQWPLKQLAQPPKWTEAPVTEPGLRGIFYDGLPFQNKPSRVFAWLGLPAGASAQHKVPGMVLVHGGGGTAHARWVRLWNQRGFAAIAMDTCGAGLAANEPAQKRLPDGGPPGWDRSFGQMDWPVEDQWGFHAVADIVLAHSLLRSLPEVDAEKTGLTGISWGGYLTCLAAGVDQRFKFAAPVYGCGFLGDDSVWKSKLDGLGPVGEKWLSLWDPSHYLPQATMPMLWVAGDSDFAYPLSSEQKSYRLPPGQRYLAIRHNMPHGHPAGETPPEILALARQLFFADAPLAQMTGQGQGGQGGDQANAWAKFSFQKRMTQGTLVCSLDANPRRKEQWTTSPATVDSEAGRVSATLPAGTRTYFFMVQDEAGRVASSEHVELKDDKR